MATTREPGAAARPRGRVIPFPPRRRAALEARPYAEVAQARDQSEALVIRSLLEAHGIRALLRTHVAPSVHPFTVGHQGEVRILVPEASAAEARHLLARAHPRDPRPRREGP